MDVRFRFESQRDAAGAIDDSAFYFFFLRSCAKNGSESYWSFVSSYGFRITTAEESGVCGLKTDTKDHDANM